MEAKKRRWEDASAPEIDTEDARKMIEPLTREQLMDILQQATVNHSDVLEDVRKVVDKDTTHRKLFVRGLGYETTTDSLKSVFSQHGEVEEAVVIVDKATGKNKGYGFVTFKHMDGALSALKDPSKKVDGRMTVSNLASQGASQQQNLLQQQLQQQLQYQQLMMQSVQVVQPVQPVQPVQHVQPVQPVQHVQPVQPVQHVQPVQPVQPVLAQLPSADAVLRKIYVGNVPADMTAARLLSFFSQFGEVEEGPLGYDKQTGKSKGFALLVFKTVEAAQKALEDPVKSIDGQQLFCKLALEGQKQKALANQGQPASVSSDGGYVNPASLNPGIQYSALGHGLVNSALGVSQSAANATALAHQGLSPYALSDAALAGLSSHNQGLPGATSLSHNSSLNLSTPSSLGRDLLLQGLSTVSSAARTSLGAGSYGIGSYGSSGYAGIGGAASLYGIPSSSSVSQTAAYQGASHYGLSSYQSQQTGASPASRISAAGFLQGLPPF